jgi:hypothetical protein
MKDGSNNGIGSKRQEQDTKKQRIFKFLDGLALGNMTSDFSEKGLRNLASKFKINQDQFQQIVEEYRQRGGDDASKCR